MIFLFRIAAEICNDWIYQDCFSPSPLSIRARNKMACKYSLEHVAYMCFLMSHSTYLTNFKSCLFITSSE